MIIVNASAAREGGALTILESFCRSIESTSERYLILSPRKPNITANGNITWIRIETFGLGTLIFALLLVYYYVVKYNARKIISFSNLNVVLPVDEKVTYFHQLLVFKSSDFKFKIYRFLLRFFFQSKSTFIVQTNYVKSLFLSTIPQCRSIEVRWPGIDLSGDFDFAQDVEIDIDIGSYDRVFIFPVSDISLMHKNYMYLEGVHDEFKAKNILVLIPTNVCTGLSNYHSIGYKSRSDWLRLLKCCDGVIVTSLYETICLPIFESIVLNKISLVLKADYIDGLLETFGCIDNLFVFESVDELLSCLYEKASVIPDSKKYTLPDWRI
ncbi:hypothetical protein LZT07_20245 [Vibrio fluvialis]|uniref:hypothetical protein n=1 Tax=Vibrio fluvialis TaxID=676 RepID=UPI001F344D4E|nr:hypothetical protein [Vibrio fluvialis]MCE7639644.1 hypothetical protein [Vibrio fluvialis]UPO64711.1 mannosyltransferase [Vibrio fluvialis]